MSKRIRYATYSEIASYRGITRQAVGNKMHGKSQVTLEEVLKLYLIDGVTMWELKDIIDEETKIYQDKKGRGLWKNQK